MPKMDAVRSRNWAMTEQLPAATSWASEIASDAKAKATAATKLATATDNSTRRDIQRTRLWSEGPQDGTVGGDAISYAEGTTERTSVRVLVTQIAQD